MGDHVERDEQEWAEQKAEIHHEESEKLKKRNIIQEWSEGCIATAKHVKLPWRGRRDGSQFRCYLCGHHFMVGDYFRFRWGTKNGTINFLVCKECDTDDAVERVKSIDRAAWWKGD